MNTSKSVIGILLKNMTTRTNNTDIKTLPYTKKFSFIKNFGYFLSPII